MARSTKQEMASLFVGAETNEDWCGALDVYTACTRMAGCCAKGGALAHKIKATLSSFGVPCKLPTCVGPSAEVYLSKQVATTVTVAVASCVTLAVANSVAGAVASSVSSSVGTSSASGAAAGGAAQAMIAQAQFMAISARVGSGGSRSGAEANQTQPEAVRALGEGMMWVNFHLFAFPDSCSGVEEEALELWGTLASMMWVLAGVAVMRAVLDVALKWQIVQCGGVVPQSGLFPFPAWELTILDTQVLGIFESTGFALGTGCVPYMVSGGLFTVLFSIMFGALGYVVYFGIAHASLASYQTNACYFKGFKLSQELLQEPVEGPEPVLQPKETDGTQKRRRSSILVALERRRDSVLEQMERVTSIKERLEATAIHGEWKDEQEESSETFFQAPLSNFTKRYGVIFTDYRSRSGLLYRAWVLARSLAMGITLGVVTTPVVNSVLSLAIFGLDCVIVTATRPWLDALSNYSSAFTALVRVGQLSGVTLF
eukprot:276595-Rhodomonas_salina.1